MSAASDRRPRKLPKPPAVRPPQQDRSRAAWQRILDAGVHELAEVGVRGFTVSKVCERAGVAVTAVYSRLDSRDDLLAAAYEHGILHVQETHAELARIGAEAPSAVAAVAVLQQSFRANGRFIRATVLGSAESSYIASRGAANVAALRSLFVDAAAGTDADDAAKEIAAAFFVGIFSALALAVAFGGEFTTLGTAVDPVTRLGAALSEALGQPAVSRDGHMAGMQI